MGSLATSLAIAAFLVLALAPGAASAQPGSAVDQYREHIPEGDGDRPSKEVGASDPAALPPAVADELESLGDDGAAAADLARRTSPPGADGEPEAGRDESDPGADSGSSPVTATVGRLGGDGGMGIVLPLILGVGLIAALGVLLARRRLGARGADR